MKGYALNSFVLLSYAVSCVINVFAGKVFTEINSIEAIFGEEVEGILGNFRNNSFGFLVCNGSIKKCAGNAGFSVIAVNADEKKMHNVAGGRVGHAKTGYGFAVHGSIDGNAFAVTECFDKVCGFFAFEEKFFFNLLEFGAVCKDLFNFAHNLNHLYAKKLYNSFYHRILQVSS